MEGKEDRQRVTKKLRMIGIMMPGSRLRRFLFRIYSILRVLCVLYIYACPLAYSNASSPQIVTYSILFQAAICLLFSLRSSSSCLRILLRLLTFPVFPSKNVFQETVPTRTRLPLYKMLGKPAVK